MPGLDLPCQKIFSTIILANEIHVHDVDENLWANFMLCTVVFRQT